MEEWRRCKRILCIRPDNMGDLVMSGPAFRALKESFGSHITLLTSSAGSPVVPFLPAVDDVIVSDLPWVKLQHCEADVCRLAERLKAQHFDAAIIFTVYSQSALPAALLAYLANIPLRLAYCRENPYELLTHWAVEKEPFSMIRHQVERDLELVRTIGAHTGDHHLMLTGFSGFEAGMKKKLFSRLGSQQPYLVVHAGVSEQKREYPVANWRALLTAIAVSTNLPMVCSGSGKDAGLISAIANGIPLVHRVDGELCIGEWICLIANARALVSVNTAAIHIAAAVQCPTMVLYALTNPQHTPWMVPSFIFPFALVGNERSRNQIVGYVQELYATVSPVLPAAAAIVSGLQLLLETPCTVRENQSIIHPPTERTEASCVS
ncbi:MAG: glycosyltransferase family 9 protein [Agriterribacter sp.]